MRKSSVLSGRLNQRDRAQQRGKLDRTDFQPATTAQDDLLAWFKSAIGSLEVSEIEKLDLTEYLRNTGQFGLPPSERLRQLAIFFEPGLMHTQPRGWLALDRIYQQAAILDPKAVSVHHTRALAAKNCAECVPPADEIFRRLLRAAWNAAHSANELAPEDADVLHELGSICYIDDSRSIEESLVFFDQAIASTPKHQWALLYRAHCLQDLQEWSEAAAAYDAVDAAFFVGPLVWRYELLLEQKAYCLLRSGNRELAITQFKRLLDRWDSNPELTIGLMGINITEASCGELRDELWQDFSALVHRERLGWL